MSGSRVIISLFTAFPQCLTQSVVPSQSTTGARISSARSPSTRRRTAGSQSIHPPASVRPHPRNSGQVTPARTTHPGGSDDLGVWGARRADGRRGDLESGLGLGAQEHGRGSHIRPGQVFLILLLLAPRPAPAPPCSSSCSCSSSSSPLLLFVLLRVLLFPLLILLPPRALTAKFPIRHVGWYGAPPVRATPPQHSKSGYTSSYKAPRADVIIWGQWLGHSTNTPLFKRGGETWINRDVLF